jgi:hypothetical protein
VRVIVLAFPCKPFAILADARIKLTTCRTGKIEHFYPKDLEEHLAKREAQPQKDLSKDPESDTYAVAKEGDQLVPL